MFNEKATVVFFILLLGGQEVAAGAVQLGHLEGRAKLQLLAQAQRLGSLDLQRLHELGGLESVEGLRAALQGIEREQCDGAAVAALDEAQAAVHSQVAALARSCLAARARGATSCAAGTDTPVDAQALLRQLRDFAQKRQRAMRCDWAEEWLGETPPDLLADLRAIWTSAPELDAASKRAVPLDFDALESLALGEVLTEEGLMKFSEDAMAKFLPADKAGLTGLDLTKQAELISKEAAKLAEHATGDVPPMAKLSALAFCYHAENTTWNRVSGYVLGSSTGCGADQGCFAVRGPASDGPDGPALQALLGAELVEVEGNAGRAAELSWGVCLPSQGRTAARQYFAELKAEIRLVAELAATAAADAATPSEASLLERRTRSGLDNIPNPFWPIIMALEKVNQYIDIDIPFRPEVLFETAAYTPYWTGYGGLQGMSVAVVLLCAVATVYLPYRMYTAFGDLGMLRRYIQDFGQHGIEMVKKAVLCGGLLYSFVYMGFGAMGSVGIIDEHSVMPHLNVASADQSRVAQFESDHLIIVLLVTLAATAISTLLWALSDPGSRWSAGWLPSQCAASVAQLGQAVGVGQVATPSVTKEALGLPGESQTPARPRRAVVRADQD